METAVVKVAFEKALQVMVNATPLLGPVASVLLDSARDAEVAAKSGLIEKLDTEAKRQELSLHMARLQAQVAQELAIAHRIERAVEVEIEEYYEGSAKGGVNGSVNITTTSVSFGADGRRVTRRVYRFKGNVDAFREVSPDSQ